MQSTPLVLNTLYNLRLRFTTALGLLVVHHVFASLVAAFLAIAILLLWRARTFTFALR